MLIVLFFFLPLQKKRKTRILMRGAADDERITYDSFDERRRDGRRRTRDERRLGRMYREESDAEAESDLQERQWEQAVEAAEAVEAESAEAYARGAAYAAAKWEAEEADARGAETDEAQEDEREAYAAGIRVFARHGGVDADLALLESLPIACETIEPMANRWVVVDGTAVVRAAFSKDDVSDGVRALMRRAPKNTKSGNINRFVVIVETPFIRAGFLWQPAYECDGITLTTYAGTRFVALVSASDRVVLIDEDVVDANVPLHEQRAFFSCTLIDPSQTRVGNEQIAREDYCAGARGTRLRVESMYLCHQKILRFARAEKLARSSDGHEIKGVFDRVFVTSDIHADLRKFVQILLACDLVTIGKYRHEDIYAEFEDTRGAQKEKGNKKEKEKEKEREKEKQKKNEKQKIYEIVWDVRWRAPKTLLVICGDLIDGLRGGDGTGDALGSYEFLLHCLLFNLRIQARTMGSDVRFTIGNHDAGTVTAYPPNMLAEPYVEKAHIAFASFFVDLATQRQREKYNMICRRDMLMPFYACSPYVMLTLGTTVFAHAGFVKEKGSSDSVYSDALISQRALDRAELDEQTDLVKFFRPTKGIMDVMWSRGYAELPLERACDAQNEAHKKFELIVVGHCVTHTYDTLDLAGQCAGDVTGEKGCVITRDCLDGPLIALVDTGMSASFRSNTSETNETRGVGMLLLDKSRHKLPELRKVGPYHVYRLRALERACLIDHHGSVSDYV